METIAITSATVPQDIPLSLLMESATNPRQHFEESTLNELAETIRKTGVFQAILARPKDERLEIVFGARRFRASLLAGKDTIPALVREMSDTEVLEAQLVENLQRRDVHPMEEAEGYKRLLTLAEPTYTVEQIAAKVGKSPAYITTRLKLTELCDEATAAFYQNHIGVGHALLLAKLPASQQIAALRACFKEVYTGGDTPAHVLLPVRNLQFWIATNVLLLLKDAPFNKRDSQLVPSAGSCAECPKRTGHNKLLFGDDLGKQGDQCTDPTCYQAKVSAHIQKTVAAKPELVQISTAYGAQEEGSPVLPRNKYTVIRDERPKSKDEAKRPEYKECKFTTEAIITEGTDVGTTHKVCANANCPVHHPKQPVSRDESWKAEQEKQRKETAIANTVGLRILTAIGSAVPVRLLKRDLLLIIDKLTASMDDSRVEMLARQHGIRQKRDDGGVKKTFTAFLKRADEGTLSRITVEASILLAASRGNSTNVLKDAATAYKVDTDAIAAKVRQEFSAKEKAKRAAQPAAKTVKKAA